MSTMVPALTWVTPPSQVTSMPLLTIRPLAAMPRCLSVAQAVVAHVVLSLHVGAQIARPDCLVEQLLGGAASCGVGPDHLTFDEGDRPQLGPAGVRRGRTARAGTGRRPRGHSCGGGHHEPGERHQNPQPGAAGTASPTP